MRKDYTYSRLTSFWLTTLLIGFFTTQQGIAQYCTLTCIEDLQVSVGLDCEATINYRTVLQDPDNPFTCSPNGPSAYKVEVMTQDSVVIPTSPTVSCDYIGQTLTVKARHWLTGNSCWSTITIEDKAPPRIDCGGDVTIWCNESAAPANEGGIIPLPTLLSRCSDECETLTYTYQDQTEVFDCDDERYRSGLSARINRRWTACDQNNNCTSCTQTIHIRSIDISDIELPTSSTISCGDGCDLDDAVCVGGPTLHGKSLNTGFCRIDIRSEDDVTAGCEGTATIYRNWYLTNTCTNETIQHTQTISIIDNTPPTITCPSGPIQMQATPNPNSCSSNILVPPAIIEDDCSSLGNIQVSTAIYVVRGEGERELLTRRENANGGFFQVVPIGTIAIVYEATDDCGNTHSTINDPCIVEIIDNIPPTPVCNGSTQLSITSGGSAIIFAQSFNSASYDNCCIASYQVRRMDQEDSPFTDFVEFTCADVGRRIMVVLRITDCSGNTADCMVEAEVDDKAPPVFTSCPPSILIDCKDGVSINDINENFLGMPTIEDACTPNETFLILTIRDDFRNECGLGSIVYEWTAADGNGNSSSCEQIVSFFDNTPFNVSFPPDFSSNQCSSINGLTPDVTGSPIVTGVDCERVEVTFDDVIAPSAAYCRRIERTWTVANVCATNPNAPDAVIRHVQILDIDDTEAPIVNCGTNVSICIDNDDCNVSVDVSAPSIQDCSDDLDVRATWVFIPADDCAGERQTGQVSNAIAGFTSPHFGPGNLYVTFEVRDDCGNTSSCEIEYEIKDCKAPTVACQSGIVLPLEEDGRALFWASDFDEKSFDNCGSCFGGVIYFSFSENIGDSSILYTCSDIGEQPVTIFITDASGNQTYCETNIIIQSPNGVCDNNTGGTNGGTNSGTTTGGDNSGTNGGTNSGTTTGGDNSGTNGGTNSGTTTGGDNSGTNGGTNSGTTTGGDNSGTNGGTNSGTTTGGDNSGTNGGTNSGTTTGGDNSGTNGGTNSGTTTGGDNSGTNGGTNSGTTTGGDNSGTNGGTNSGTTTGGDNSGTNGGDNGGTLPPIMIDGCGTEEVCITGNNCLTSVNVTALDITQSCGDTLTSEVTWQFIPKEGCAGMEMSGQFTGALNGFTSPEFGPGVFTVTYEVTDGCGNTATCIRTYEIEDCQAPTARCFNGLTLGLGVDGTVEFWAKDYNQNTTDNCKDCEPKALFFSFSEELADSNIIFDCNDIGPQTIDIYVTDASGNQTICTVNFTVTGVDTCDQNRMATIDGTIFTEVGNEVAFVDVVLEDMERGAESTQSTSSDGGFQFDVLTTRDYLLKPQKQDQLDNGVTTFDMILIQRHILGQEKFISPYQLIAADVNNSGSITALDLVLMRKAILHLDESFPNNTAWRFVDANYQFSDPANPTKELMSEEVYIQQLATDRSHDFIAIKIGDVNGSAKIGENSAPRSDETVFLNVEDRRLQKGEMYDVTFTAADNQLQGIQFTLRFNNDDLALNKIPANDWINKNNIGKKYLDKGLLTLSWNKTTVNPAPFTYTIQLEAQRDGMLSHLLDINSTLTPVEAYTEDGKVVNVQLNYIKTGLPFELLQNIPNPFAQNTIIPFTLPKRDQVKIMVMNTSGKILRQIEQEFDKGYNEVVIENINTSGVLYYYIKTSSNVATRKMVRLE